ncbi:MAG TPA: TonB family protein [Candidatus Sulfotelmatobacter sp.]|nr:TonB family protein [Candidatus Sulfotelmatobacter sp.]
MLTDVPLEIAQSTPVPRLLVELPSRRGVFFGNLRDLVFSERHAPLELRSAPAAFWPDVFVKRRLPWDGFVQSGAYHLIAIGLLIGLSHLLALQPRVVTKPVFEQAQVIYYQPSEYLPPLDTRNTAAPAPEKADPELSRQPIISVPPEADNRSQTIVTPPKVRLKQNVPLPNIVAWSDGQKPRLFIPPAPLTPAAEITRIGPELDTPVVTPPPDSSHLAQRRKLPALPNSVVAPPPDVHSSTSAHFEELQPALIAPPPTVDTTSNRPLRDMNIAPSAVIAPAPQLPLEAQRIAPGGHVTGLGTPQVVPPPPSVSSAASSGGSFGERGHVIALNLHPAVGAPPEPPAGNRRGSFAATPEGHAGASGSPSASSSGTHTGTGNIADGRGAKGSSGLPSGLYVGKASEKSSTVAGDPAPSTRPTVNPDLIASVRPPRVGATPRTMQPGDASKLSAPERGVFGDRKFYSVTLNMPNFNSAGGSWVIRFAELNPAVDSHGVPVTATDLTEPMATRKVDPAYPLQLMRENVSGTVILYAVIHADGTVGDVRILRSVDDRLDHFASAAVAQWRFSPATKNGSPVDVVATFQIPFRPSRVGLSY